MESSGDGEGDGDADRISGLPDSILHTRKMNPSCGGENKMKKKIKMEGSGDADRISSLPESILHTIFSSIDMKQVVQTSILSKRWRNFWKSAPDLCFDASLWKQTGDEEYDEKKAMNFVERVLLLRDNSANIQKLHLCFIDSDCNDIDSDPYRILTWLNFACTRHVQEVHLINCFSSYDPPTELPAQLFTTLNVLELHSYGSIRLPTSLFSAPHLRTLKLVSVSPHLPESDLNQELVLSCPCLEDLVLYRCRIWNLEILNISAPQLKNLVVENCRSRCEIKICTPNLTSLYLWSDSYKNYYLENLSSLVSCRIGGKEGSAGSSCSFCIPSLMKILNAVTNVSTLEIYGSSYRKDTLPSEGVHDKLLNPFPNLTLLRIKLSTGFSIRATVNLLRCSPSIKTLIWDAKEIYLSGSSLELKYWGELLSFQYTFHGLRDIKAQNLRGTDDELKFLEFLLKNATALQNVKITLVEWITMDEKLKEFMKKLQFLPKASPRVEISFSISFNG